MNKIVGANHGGMTMTINVHNKNFWIFFIIKNKNKLAYLYLLLMTSFRTTSAYDFLGATLQDRFWFEN